MTTPGQAAARPAGSAELAAELRRVGLDAGLDALGIAASDPFAATAVEIQRRRFTGTAGRLRFTFGDVRSTDPGRTWPWARSLVVGARSYVPEVAGPVAGAGAIARFAVGDRYAPLRHALGVVADHLREHGYQAEIVVDDNRLVDRAAAVRAGLAWWGKSTMAIAPRFGPWLLLGTVVTDAEPAVDRPMERTCGTCTACIPACPTGALDEIGHLDATKCIAYWLQTPGVIPRSLRSAIGNRLYGCDECLVSCPPGTRLLALADEVGDADAAPNGSVDGASVDVRWVLAASGDELLGAFGHFYLPRRNPDYLKRNALVVLANTGGVDDLPSVAPFLEHPLVEVRAHAVAAARALGAEDGWPPLQELAGRERRDEVLAELG